jgi:hypothetical protein
MHKDRISIPSEEILKIRMKSNGGSWVRSQSGSIKSDTSNVRIRSIKSNDEKSKWIYSDRANLKQI